MEVVLNHVAKRATFTLPPEVTKKIVDDSGGNLRKAILVLEALKMQSYVWVSHTCYHGSTLSHIRSPDLSGPLAIAKPDWETYCHKVADLIVGEQSPARVMEVRAKFYELLSHCIPPTIILKVQHCPVCFLSPLNLSSDGRRACCRARRWKSESRHHALGGFLCVSSFMFEIVSSLFIVFNHAGGQDANREQKDLSPWSMGGQSHELV